VGARRVSLPPAFRVELYVRGCATAVASWEEDARGSDGAAVVRLLGVAAAVFPSEPERSFFNNAMLSRAAAVEPMGAAYRDAGVDRYAAWVHETDEPLIGELTSRGYALSETTRAMGMAVEDVVPVEPVAEVQPIGWPEYLDYLWGAGVPRGLLGGLDGDAYHSLGVRHGGETVAAAIAYDHDGDCGIFNMSTAPGFRRRGLGTALTARHVQDAAERGCTTATLQATPMAERVYAAVGFRDLGRILEFAPSPLSGGS
jgi:ribosomal protein S18 acetylase RimI-like enzyme